MTDPMGISRLMHSPSRTAQGFIDRDNKIKAAIEMAVRYGGNDGAHHKDWVIDQMVRILAGDEYDAIIAKACAGEDGPDTYGWEIGIAP